MHKELNASQEVQSKIKVGIPYIKPNMQMATITFMQQIMAVMRAFYN